MQCVEVSLETMRLQRLITRLIPRVLLVLYVLCIGLPAQADTCLLEKRELEPKLTWVNLISWPIKMEVSESESSDPIVSDRVKAGDGGVKRSDKDIIDAVGCCNLARKMAKLNGFPHFYFYQYQDLEGKVVGVIDGGHKEEKPYVSYEKDRMLPEEFRRNGTNGNVETITEVQNPCETTDYSEFKKKSSTANKTKVIEQRFYIPSSKLTGGQEQNVFACAFKLFYEEGGQKKEIKHGGFVVRSVGECLRLVDEEQFQWYLRDVSKTYLAKKIPVSALILADDNMLVEMDFKNTELLVKSFSLETLTEIEIEKLQMENESSEEKL